ncbi:MAG: YhbY family RNA-binding protein [Candidatus Woesearchaeota archaeon]
MNKKELRDKSKHLYALVRIGKSGIGETVISEINKQLKLHKVVKIKLLKSFVGDNSRKDAAAQLKKDTGSDEMVLQGNTMTLYRKSSEKV